MITQEQVTQRKRTQPSVVTSTTVRPKKRCATRVQPTRSVKGKPPTYPYPPMGHAHQRFELSSPEFEPIDAPFTKDPIVPVIETSNEEIRKMFLKIEHEEDWLGWEKETLIEKITVLPEERDNMAEAMNEEISVDKNNTEQVSVVEGSDSAKEITAVIIKENEQPQKWFFDHSAMTGPPPVAYTENLHRVNVFEDSDVCEEVRDLMDCVGLVRQGEEWEINETNLYDDIEDVPMLIEEETIDLNMISQYTTEESVKVPLIAETTEQNNNQSKVMLYSPNSPKQIEPPPPSDEPVILEVVVINPRAYQPEVRYISDRMIHHPNWYALITYPPRGLPESHKFPTEWLLVDGQYFDEFKRLPTPLHGNSIFNLTSTKDGVQVKVEVIYSGEVFITRFQQRAIIRSARATAGDPMRLGGQRFWPKNLPVEGPEVAKSKNPREDKLGIATEDIPIDCPYWINLVGDFKYPDPSKEAAAIKKNSKIDKARCSVRAEKNGRVTVSRKGIRIELLPPFNRR